MNEGSMVKEHKEEETSWPLRKEDRKAAAEATISVSHSLVGADVDVGIHGGGARKKSPAQLNLVSALLGNCLCEPFHFGEGRGASHCPQFVELHGIRFVGLGAVVDELTPRERVYDTLEQLTTRTERLISIGYLVDVDQRYDGGGAYSGDGVYSGKVTETIPLDVWNRSYPRDQSMSRDVKNIVEMITGKDYFGATKALSKALERQKAHPNRGSNRFMAGVTAHNLGVVKVLMGDDGEAIPIFRHALALKEEAFGRNHPEVALTWDEIGIQHFARGDFRAALDSFRKAHGMRSGDAGGAAHHPRVAVVLNNIACCNFMMRNHDSALQALVEAREIQQKAMGSSPSQQVELDLLHVAVVMCNCGYVKLCLKQYDEARSLFDEALLIQQSVLDDNHRAVRDTLSNIEFTNAFHS